MNFYKMKKHRLGKCLGNYYLCGAIQNNSWSRFILFLLGTTEPLGSGGGLRHLAHALF